MKRVTHALALIVAVLTTACVKTVEIVGPTMVDTIVVQVPGQLHTDTLIIQRVDTLPGRVDTVKVVVAVPYPVMHWDTVTTIVPVIVTHTDTLVLPGVVIHDSTWVYVQQNPTNPIGGGDPHAGIAWIDLAGGFGYALVFWHGNFVGVCDSETHFDAGIYTTVWHAWLYTPPGGAMIWRGDFPSKLDAIGALVPIALTLH